MKEKDNVEVNKSVGKNIVLNVIRTLFSIIFPLITFPYVSRILQVRNLGKVNYASSIISYYALFAGLGIATYAIREGARVRNDKNQIEKFASQIFTINLISTLFIYIILFFSLIYISKFRDYTLLLWIESASILFATVGVEWINIIYEDYAYITIRSLIIQILSLLAMFIFVRQPSDYYIYASITVASQGLISLLNIIHVKKYCRLKLTWHLDIKKHIKPILILFSNNIAVSVYVNSDMTMIGWMVGAYYAGLYSVSSKIYNIIKQVLAALYNVMIARMSFYYAQNKMKEFKQLLNNTVNYVIVLSFPVTVGLICTSSEIVQIISGKEYGAATLSLQILSLAFFFAIMGGILASCVNLPLKREKINLIATTISAIENIGLNIFLIPVFKQNGAAMTTLLAEFTVSLLLFWSIRDHYEFFDFKEILNNIVKSGIAVVPIIILHVVLKYVIGITGFMYLIIEVFGSIVMYFGINYVLKNRWSAEVIQIAFNKFRRD